MLNIKNFRTLDKNALTVNLVVQAEAAGPSPIHVTTNIIYPKLRIA